MGGGKHNKGCCKKGCVIAEDDFNRNGSDLGSGWTHETGDWITVATPPWESGYAESQADGAVAINNTSHPLPDEPGVVYLDIINETASSGDKYRAIVNAVDKDNYHYAEYVRNGGADSILRLGKRSGGSDTILESRLIDTLGGPVLEPRRLRVLIADNEFCATVSHCLFSFVFVEESPITGGYKAGMGADEGCQISHFTYLQHKQTRKDCPACLCNCQDNYIPPVLNAHLVGTGRLETLDCDITLYWDRLNSWWQSAIINCCGTDWQLRFYCPNPTSDVNTAKLYMVTRGCTSSDIDMGQPDWIDYGYRYANANSTCEPLSLEFGPFAVSLSDLGFCCEGFGRSGTYTITITEAP